MKAADPPSVTETASLSQVTSSTLTTFRLTAASSQLFLSESLTRGSAPWRDFTCPNPLA